MSDKKAILAILIIIAVTAMLRFFPFAVFRGEKTPKWLSYLGKYLPYSIMGMLVIYCLKDVSFLSFGGFLPEFIASAAVIISYVFKRNTILSIILGTVIYMLLIQFVFV